MDHNELRQLEETQRASLRELTDETLSATWLATYALPMSAALSMTRGWIIDELEARMGPDRFDAWLLADADAVDPFPFLAGR